MSDITAELQDKFPSSYREILIVAFMRLLYHAPMKNMDFHFRQSYLSVLYPDISLSDKKVGLLFNSLGNRREEIRAFFKAQIFGRRDDFMLIDATHLLSYSKEMEIAKAGYNSQHEFSPQVNLLFIYSCALQHTVYYRIVAGNVREVKAFRVMIEESGIEDALIIADTGRYTVIWMRS